MKRFILTLIIGLFMIGVVSATSYTSNDKWNDDFNQGVINQTFWTDYNNTHCVSCSSVSSNMDSQNSSGGYARFQTSSDGGGNTAIAWSVLEADIINYNNGKDYRFDFTLNSTISGNDIVAIEISNSSVITFTNDAPLMENANGRTIVNQGGLIVSTPQLYHLILTSEGNATVYNSSLDILGSQNVTNQTIRRPRFRAATGGTNSESSLIQLFNFSSQQWGTILNSPSNLSTVAGSTVTFNATANIFNSTLNNATIFVYNSSGDLINSTTNSLSNDETEETTWGISGFELGEYTWSVESWGTDSSGASIKSNSGFNQTFTYGYEVISESFINSTTEGNSNLFNINITLGSGVSIDSATLVYNNTRYAGSTNQITSNNYSITRELIAPAVSTSVNNTFYWEFDLDGTLFNSTFNTQEVLNLNIDDCSSYSIVLLNYTLYDEDTQQLLNVTSNSSEIGVEANIYPVGSDTSIISFAGNFTDTNYATVCLEEDLGNSTYTLDAVAQYSAVDYATEYHNIQGFNLTNSTLNQMVSLYDLVSTRAQAFLVTYKDTSFLAVPGVLIDVTRKYVSEGVFKTVELPETDSSGQAVVNLVAKEEIYTFIVTKDGEVVATFNNVVPICQNELTNECTINLNAFSSGTDVTNFQTVNNLNYLETFDRTNRTITLIFNTIDGSNSEVNITADKFDRFGNSTACSTSLTSSSGTITCEIPVSFGNSTVISSIYANGNKISTTIYTLAADPGASLGDTRFIFLIMMVAMLPLMAITSTIAMVIMGIVGVMLGGMFLLIDRGSLLGFSSTIIWLIVAGGILIWKINQRGEG